MTFEDMSSMKGIDMPDFRLVLFRHMDRIGMLFAVEPKDGTHQRLINISRMDAVNLMEEMLSPYFDDMYKEEAKNITEDPDDPADDKRYARKKYGALIRLLSRKRFLPEEEIVAEDGVSIDNAG